MFNKIKIVEDLGILLKNGKFDKLFNLVSLLNQSDPAQNYLKHSERIYNYKYSKTNEKGYFVGRRKRIKTLSTYS